MGMKDKHVALAEECKRLAGESESAMFAPGLSADEKERLQDEARVYRQMSEIWMQSALHAEIAKPTKFTGRNTGPSQQTLKRSAFIDEVSRAIGTKNWEIITKEAVGLGTRFDGKKSKALWPVNSIVDREAKILNFIRNNANKTCLTFED